MSRRSLARGVVTRPQRLVVLAVAAVAMGAAAAIVVTRAGGEAGVGTAAAALGAGIGWYLADRILAAIGAGGELAEPPQAVPGGHRSGPAGAEEEGPITPAGRILELAAERPELRIYVPEELGLLPGILARDELLRDVGYGTLDDRAGLVAVTDRRVLFLPKGAPIRDARSVPFDELVGVRARAEGLMGALVLTGDPGDTAIGMSSEMAEGMTARIHPLVGRADEGDPTAG